MINTTSVFCLTFIIVSFSKSLLFQSMNRLIYSIFILVFFTSGSLVRAQHGHSLTDGPYIFKKEKKIIARWVQNGSARQKILDASAFNDLKEKFRLDFPYREISSAFSMRPEVRFSFRGVDSICAISDIHGEYEKYLDLLVSNGIIDKNLRWSFGKGHLVILGDCFDRGDKVTEVLWHIFGLEKQAEKAGGRVHVLLGNHEVMVLGEDLRYMNDKYRRVENILGIKYQELYSGETLLGRWLRHKPILISINDILFVHGGVSPEMIRRKMEIGDINHLFYQMQMLREVESDRDMENLIFLNEDHGPIWYRGFFEDYDFDETKADSILAYFNKKHIIVGHTTSEDFRTLFNRKIIGIDAGIGNNRPGRMLIIIKGQFFKGTANGTRIKI